MPSSTETVSQIFKVALIQTCPKAVDPEHNFSVASKHIHEAAEQGASLAVLCEYHLTGWEPRDPQFSILAKTAYDYVARYQELARKLKINIVPGTIVTEDAGSLTRQNDDVANAKSTLLNVSPFISYQGEVLGTYNKANLWHPEREHLTSGPELQLQSSQPNGEKPDKRPAAEEESLPAPHSVIETPLGPVGLLVCWDLGFPEAFRSLIRQGARIIIIPTFWGMKDLSDEGLKINPDAESLFISTTLVARAFENTCCCIFVNAGGPASEAYIGLSRVVMPIAGTLPGSFEDSSEGMRVVEVDLNILDVAERNYKVREDLARPDWHYGYSHGSAKSY